MRIKLGFKAWTTLSAMLLSLAVVSGCNEEPSSAPPAGGTGAGAGKAPDAGKGPAPVTPPAPTKPEDEKK